MRKCGVHVNVKVPKSEAIQGSNAADFSSTGGRSLARFSAIGGGADYVCRWNRGVFVWIFRPLSSSLAPFRVEDLVPDFPGKNKA